MTVLHNGGRWGVSNARYEGGRVTAYDKRSPESEMSWIDHGLGGLTAAALDRVAASESDLAVLHSALAERGELCGYPVSERFYEIGTPDALAETEAFLRRTLGTVDSPPTMR
jgi:NDP-sugar pyrophosphorylase family protein